MFRYSAFGLAIRSDFELPLLPENRNAQSKLEIRREKISNASKTLAAKSHYKVLENGDILCSIPDVAVYLIRQNEILVDHNDGVADEAIQLFLLGSALGANLYQKNYLLIHGAAVKIGNEAVIFSGNSGVGKSTLATSFIQAGFQILTDDIAAINYQGAEPIVWPAYPQLKLWKDTLVALGQSEKGLQNIYNRMEKFNFSVGEGFCSEPLRVKALFALEKSAEVPLGIQCHRLSGKDAFSAAHNDCYRIGFLQEIGQASLHFSQCTQFANEVPIYRLRRSEFNCKPSDVRDYCLGKLKGASENASAHHAYP